MTLGRCPSALAKPLPERSREYGKSVEPTKPESIKRVPANPLASSDPLACQLTTLHVSRPSYFSRTSSMADDPLGTCRRSGSATLSPHTCHQFAPVS